MTESNTATVSAPAVKAPRKARKEAPEAPARGRGRPQNFPGVDTVTRLYNLPASTIALVEELAERRQENLGVTVNAMLLRAHKEMTRK